MYHLLFTWNFKLFKKKKTSLHNHWMEGAIKQNMQIYKTFNNLLLLLPPSGQTSPVPFGIFCILQEINSIFKIKLWDNIWGKKWRDLLHSFLQKISPASCKWEKKITNVNLICVNPLLHNNAFWRLWNTMYLKILWKLEQMLHFP